MLLLGILIKDLHIRKIDNKFCDMGKSLGLVGEVIDDVGGFSELVSKVREILQNSLDAVMEFISRMVGNGSSSSNGSN